MEFAMETTLTLYRTKLLTEQQATAFARMLRCNRKFERVQLCHSAQAKGEKQWLVRFAPSATARQEALLRTAQDQRAQRAATEPMVFAANRREVWVYSIGSGQTYSMLPDGRACSCPDSQARTGPAGILCKHALSWLASDEKRDLDAAERRRAEQEANFDRIFA